MGNVAYLGNISKTEGVGVLCKALRGHCAQQKSLNRAHHSIQRTCVESVEDIRSSVFPLARKTFHVVKNHFTGAKNTVFNSPCAPCIRCKSRCRNIVCSYNGNRAQGLSLNCRGNDGSVNRRKSADHRWGRCLFKAFQNSFDLFCLGNSI